MNIQRLKFAYARGARIECQGYDTHWYGTKTPAWNSRYRYRIHPDDAHLEYGPLSTALRARTQLQYTARTVAETLFLMVDEIGSVDFFESGNWFLSDLWDDFCAEALADRGL